MSEIIEKRFYSIREISRMLREPVSTVRHWIGFFNIEHRPSKARMKSYSESEVEKLRNVKSGVKKGLKLKFIKV